MKLLPITTIVVLWISLLGMTDSAFICNKLHARFQCQSGECITLAQKCNFKDDCVDRSDEEDCVHPACNETHFTCANGKCIYNSWTCDRSDDCFDGSDETEELCSDHECNENEFQCEGSQICFPNSYKCDGDYDCEGEEDEEHCATEGSGTLDWELQEVDGALESQRESLADEGFIETITAGPDTERQATSTTTATTQQSTCSFSEYMERQDSMQKTVDRLVEVIEVLSERFRSLETYLSTRNKEPAMELGILGPSA